MVALLSKSATERSGQRSIPSGRASSRRARSTSFEVLQGSFSARRVERLSPLLANLHRASSGVLAGLGLTVVGLSALSFHWQSVWAGNYTQLQASRTLEQKLQESSALLEQHHLAAVRKPGQLVPTSSQQLLHLPAPSDMAPPTGIALLSKLPQAPIAAGY